MPDSGPLQTTPGQFDYPPASTTPPMDHPSDRRRRRPAPPAGSHPADSNSRDADETPPWVPSSPETRGRMQRVLRRVQELQDNEDTRRDIERRLHENEHRLRVNVERLRENEERLRDTGRRISQVEGQMRDFDPSNTTQHPTAAHDLSLPPISSFSSHQSGPQHSHMSMPNVTPVRAALREAGERLRMVNNELQSLLDRPLGSPDDQRQRLSSVLSNVHDDMRRMLEPPDAVLGALSTASAHHDSRLSTTDNPSTGPLQDSLRRLRQVQADFEPLLSPYLSNSTQPRRPTRDEREPRGRGTDRLRARLAQPATATSQPASTLSPRGTTWTTHFGYYAPSVRGPAPRANIEDVEAGPPRRKRRRLDDDHSPFPLPLVQYGYEGQVVPGRLKLELVSSDGGIVEPPMVDFMNTTYGAENVLKDDLSVYCTKSQRCNMVLQHQNQTSFCLERLVIKAPKTGFTDPVQEGLVFVSMRNDEIFDRTARYQIYSFPISRFASHFASSADPDQGASLEIEHSILEPIRPSGLQNNNQEGVRFDDDYDEDSDNDNNNDDDDDDTNQRSHHLEQLASLNGANRVESDDDSEVSSDDGPHPHHPYGYTRHALSRMGRRYYRSGGAAQRAHTENVQAQRAFDSVLTRGARLRRQRRQQGPSSSTGSTAGVPNSGPLLDFLTPAARFSMHSKTEHDTLAYASDSHSQHDNSDTMTISFDPPVSGKFILLKMWSARHGGNIDVQNVSAYGFAGPRWFPSIQCR